MKKTITINLKGINFIFEEDAYHQLQTYMDKLDKALHSNEDKAEILDDVELRIAELCSNILNDSKTVIEEKDIQEILKTLGEPSSFVEGDEMEDESFESKSHSSDQKFEKRLFRDTDNAMFGGVCSGIANYFSIDVVIARAIFVLMFMLALSGFPIYVILWIIIPSAKTNIDRLRMKGRPVTVDSLKDEVEQAAERIKDGSKRFAQKLRNDEYGNRDRFSRGARIVANIIGAFLLFHALVMLALFVVFVVVGVEFVPVNSENGFLSLADLSELVIADSSDQFLLWTGGIIGGMSVILFFVLLGSMLLFKLKNKWTRLSLLGVFVLGFVGFILTLIVGLKTGRDFTIEGEIERELGTTKSTELNINSKNNTPIKSSQFKVKSQDFSLMVLDGKNIEFHGVKLIFKPSTDSSFHVYQNLSARGYSHKDAVERSKHIKHNVQMSGDTVSVDLNYKFPKEDKIRDQEVTLIIEMPKNGVVKLNGKDFRLGSKGKEDIEQEDYYEEGYLYSDGQYDHYH